MNITKLVREYIEQHPPIRDSMRIGIVNYSKLSRIIGSELGAKNFDAILVACRRYYKNIKQSAEENGKRLKSSLKDSKIEIKNQVSSAVVDKRYYLSNMHKLKKLDFNAVHGYGTVTIITSSESIKQLRKIFRKIIDIKENLAEIRLKIPEKIGDIGDTAPYISGILSDNGIKVIESISTWQELIFAVDETDISKAIEVLRI